ncbi:MAG: radical SAM protein [Candidatus Bathyarchaeota archaeon]|nr:radical SAM protein [Candidatus Bathyarchaeota archaeon]
MAETTPIKQELHSFNSKDVLVLDSKWVLRNDKTYVVLYLVSSSETKVWILPAPLSYAIAFINGRNTFDQICFYIGKVFGIEKEFEAKQKTTKIINVLKHNGVGVSILAENQGYHPNIYETKDFFVPVRNYKGPFRNRLKVPTSINLFTTKKCNTNCLYCYADRRPDDQGNLLSMNEWKAIIDECIALNIWNIGLVGGDQLASSDSFAVVKYLLGKQVPVFISTKCEVTDKIAKDLVVAGFLSASLRNLNELQLSVDSANSRNADLLTGTSGFLERVCRSIDCCTAHGIVPKIKAVLTPFNYMEIEEIISYFSEKGIVDFQFVHCGRSYFKENKNLLLTEDMKKWIHDSKEQVLAKYPNFKITIQDEPPRNISRTEKIETWKRRAKCSGGYSSLTILPTGFVIACEQIPQIPQYFMGNIRDGGIMGVWNNEKIERFLFPEQSLFKGSPCGKCDEFVNCFDNAGFCFRDAIFAYDDIFQAPPSCPNQNRKPRRLS